MFEWDLIRSKVMEHERGIYKFWTQISVWRNLFWSMGSSSGGCQVTLPSM
jgi:hypothetical protein